LVGEAVKVIEEPAQVGLEPAVIAIDTDGTTTGFTVMVIPALVAVVGLAQVALEVSIQVTICPFVRVVVVNVGLLVPALIPFTCH
jgi:hypothetical protein